MSPSGSHIFCAFALVSLCAHPTFLYFSLRPTGAAFHFSLSFFSFLLFLLLVVVVVNFEINQISTWWIKHLKRVI